MDLPAEAPVPSLANVSSSDSERDQDQVIQQLLANWVWIANWTDASKENSVGRILTFKRNFTLPSRVQNAVLRCSADTRYKLYVNDIRIGFGPSRGSNLTWYYDTHDIAPHLRQGQNEVRFVVLRYFAAVRGAMPFARTTLPGLTVVGDIETVEGDHISLRSACGWLAYQHDNILFPSGLADDVFLHINERVTPGPDATPVEPVPYNIKTLNGELAPWRLRPRMIPMPEESPATIEVVKRCDSSVPKAEWEAFFSASNPLLLPANSSHAVHVQADVHSTAVLRWGFAAAKDSTIKLKATYSEGYELEPRGYPFFRRKVDRLDETSGRLIGPRDEVFLDIKAGQTTWYEPFWFRTFRIIGMGLDVGENPITLQAFSATQVNYPLAIKALWEEPDNPQSSKIWEISVRTMRNCMFDGYSDCPFYEQLQYSGDSRSVGLFHYLLSGDDRLMKQAIIGFAASITAEGLTQSRFPSHVPQIIAGFSLYWILQVCDHHLYFGDKRFTRSFLPRIDGVLDFFDSHVDELGLVSGLPSDVWQFVDWVTTWGATNDHPDKGVPVSGRETNRHTYFSMLYAYVLRLTAELVRDVGRPGHAVEYEARAASINRALRRHCFDGEFFTDSTADIADDMAYSQHCQVFGVLCGATKEDESARMLLQSFENPLFSQCSYMMMFYSFRALALAGDHVYESLWDRAWKPWHKMLHYNLTTWEEDNVRQRSDCHAWGSVPIYEYCTELAGIHLVSSRGAKKIFWKPRLRLSGSLRATVAVGGDNVARVSWHTLENGTKQVSLHLDTGLPVSSQMPEGIMQDHGVISFISFDNMRC